MPRASALGTIYPQIKYQSITTKVVPSVDDQRHVIPDHIKPAFVLQNSCDISVNHGVISEIIAGQSSDSKAGNEKDILRLGNDSKTRDEKDILQRQDTISVQNNSSASNVGGTIDSVPDPATMEALHGLLLLTSDRAISSSSIKKQVSLGTGQGLDVNSSAPVNDETVNVAKDVVIQKNRNESQKKGRKSFVPEKRFFDTPHRKLTPHSALLIPANETITGGKSRKLKKLSKSGSRKLKKSFQSSKLADTVLLRRSPRKSVSGTHNSFVLPGNVALPSLPIVVISTTLDIVEEANSRESFVSVDRKSDDLPRDDLPAMTCSNTNLLLGVEGSVTRKTNSAATDVTHNYDAPPIYEDISDVETLSAFKASHLPAAAQCNGYVYS